MLFHVPTSKFLTLTSSSSSLFSHFSLHNPSKLFSTTPLHSTPSLKMATTSNPHSTLPTPQPQPPPPTTLLYLCLIMSILLSSLPINAFDITKILSHYPDLSDFTTLLTTTGVAADLTHRTSVTILAVPNSHLRSSSPTTFPSTSPTTLADVIRYHVILQYLTWSDLRQPQSPTGKLITTLLTTTGRAPDNLGSLNLTFDSSDGVASFHPPNNSSVTSSVISLLKTFPFNISIFTVDSLLQPYSFDLMASETRPPIPGLNLTKALIDGHNFNVATSMLLASGVLDDFEQDEGGAGITLFVPTDMAFANLPPSGQLQALSADKKVLVLKFHVLHSYYPLGSLESIVNPVQPTLATELNGAGRFTLNISRVNGSVAINTGIVQAVVTQTVFDQNPVAIFGVSCLLLPKELFGKNTQVALRSGSGGGPFVGAQPPDIGPGPESSKDEGYGEPSHLSSPPGNASKGWHGGSGAGVVSLCIGLLLYVLVCKK